MNASIKQQVKKNASAKKSLTQKTCLYIEFIKVISDVNWRLSRASVDKIWLSIICLLSSASLLSNKRSERNFY